MDKYGYYINGIPTKKGSLGINETLMLNDIENAKVDFYYQNLLKATSYYVYGKLHKEDGPAKIKFFIDGNIRTKEYYINGKHPDKGITFIEYNNVGDIAIKIENNIEYLYKDKQLIEKTEKYNGLFKYKKTISYKNRNIESIRIEIINDSINKHHIIISKDVNLNYHTYLAIMKNIEIDNSKMIKKLNSKSHTNSKELLESTQLKQLYLVNLSLLDAYKIFNTITLEEYEKLKNLSDSLLVAKSLVTCY